MIAYFGWPNWVSSKLHKHDSALIKRLHLCHFFPFSLGARHRQPNQSINLKKMITPLKFKCRRFHKFVSLLRWLTQILQSTHRPNFRCVVLLQQNWWRFPLSINITWIDDTNCNPMCPSRSSNLAGAQYVMKLVVNLHTVEMTYVFVRLVFSLTSGIAWTHAFRRQTQ